MKPSISRAAYIAALAVASVSAFAQLAMVIGSWAGMRFEPNLLFWLSLPFASPVPAPLLLVIPKVFQIALLVGFAALLVRRLALFARARSIAPPAALTAWARWLLLVAVASLLLSHAMLVLAVLARVEFGMLGGIAGFPSALLLAPVLFFIECRSLFGAGAATDQSLR